MLDRHRATDALDTEPDVAAKTTARIARLTHDAQQLREWLATHPTDRHGPMGGLRKSNRTDNERAKMATEQGVIQGYTGVAAIDAKHQIIVDAQAHGTGSEHELLLPMVTALAALRVPALIDDPDMRKRDERFAARDHHTRAQDPLHDKSRDATRALPVFAPSDFTYDADARTCVCPAGKSLYRKGASNVTNGYVGEHFRVMSAVRPNVMSRNGVGESNALACATEESSMGVSRSSWKFGECRRRAAHAAVVELLSVLVNAV